MSVSILGKTAIVTGAANGVGLAISRHFIQQGANVVLADMDEDSLKSEVNSLQNEKGKAISFSGDLREKLTQANLLSATIDEFDRVDILVNASRQFLTSDPLNSDPYSNPPAFRSIRILRSPDPQVSRSPDLQIPRSQKSLHP